MNDKVKVAKHLPVTRQDEIGDLIGGFHRLLDAVGHREPDPLRMRNREALIDVVSDIVRGGKPIEAPLMRALAAPLVPPADLDQFVAMAFNDLHHLHEGSVARYRLRPLEFRAWKQSSNAIR